MHHSRASTRRRRALPTALLASTLSIGAAGALALAVPSAPVAAVDQAPDAPNSGALGDAAYDALDALERAQTTRRPSVYRKYLAARNDVATRTAGALQVDAGEMRAAWSHADLSHQVAVLAAISQLGVPYQTYASSEGSGFDCSGLTSYAWARAGYQIEHQSARQLNAAASRDRDSAQPGDLVEYPGHVMMYLGAGDAIVHSPYTGKTVELSTISSGRSVRFGDPTG